jgi:hypothetical protein
MVVYIQTGDIAATATPKYYSFDDKPLPPIITTIHYFPQIVYLYGVPCYEFWMPDGYTLLPDIDNYENIKYVVNKDGDTIIDIPVVCTIV